MKVIIQPIVWFLELLFFFGAMGALVVIVLTIISDYRYLILSDEEAEKYAREHRPE